MVTAGLKLFTRLMVKEQMDLSTKFHLFKETLMTTQILVSPFREVRYRIGMPLSIRISSP